MTAGDDGNGERRWVSRRALVGLIGFVLGAGGDGWGADAVWRRLNPNETRIPVFEAPRHPEHVGGRRPAGDHHPHPKVVPVEHDPWSIAAGAVAGAGLATFAAVSLDRRWVPEGPGGSEPR